MPWEVGGGQEERKTKTPALKHLSNFYEGPTGKPNQVSFCNIDVNQLSRSKLPEYN